MATLRELPGGYADDTGRRLRFQAAHPQARIWADDRDWRGEWSLGGDPLRSRPHWQLGALMDEMDRWERMAAERRLMMLEFPAWHVYVTSAFTWAAFPLGWPELPPPLVTARDAGGLRATVRAARESWRMVAAGTGR